MRHALGRNPAVLGQVPADRIAELGALLHHQAARAAHQRGRLLLLGFTATNRMFGRCAASQINTRISE